MKDVLERIYKPLRVPKVSKKIKKFAEDESHVSEHDY